MSHLPMLFQDCLSCLSLGIQAEPNEVMDSFCPVVATVNAGEHIDLKRDLGMLPLLKLRWYLHHILSFAP